MSDRVRVYELARELGLTNKELMALLENEGCTVRSHSSTLEADTADLIRDMVIAERQKEQQKHQDNFFHGVILLCFSARRQGVFAPHSPHCSVG